MSLEIFVLKIAELKEAAAPEHFIEILRSEADIMSRISNNGDKSPIECWTWAWSG